MSRSEKQGVSQMASPGDAAQRDFVLLEVATPWLSFALRACFAFFVLDSFADTGGCAWEWLGFALSGLSEAKAEPGRAVRVRASRTRAKTAFMESSLASSLTTPALN
jgi:hypothetical protein